MLIQPGWSVLSLDASHRWGPFERTYEQIVFGLSLPTNSEASMACDWGSISVRAVLSLIECILPSRIMAIFFSRVGVESSGRLESASCASGVLSSTCYIASFSAMMRSVFLFFRNLAWRWTIGPGLRRFAVTKERYVGPLVDVSSSLTFPWRRWLGIGPSINHLPLRDSRLIAYRGDGIGVFVDASGKGDYNLKDRTATY
ncbi:hypothetical protein NMY22_g3896 [Coprinellus aureogranulatus]|nr:hypothetical protein NMY22_g3896 [Coprinellus aureogranulatus]